MFINTVELLEIFKIKPISYNNNIFSLNIFENKQIDQLSTGALGDVSFYNNDKALPIFNTGKKARYTIPEAAKILLKSETTQKCTKTPLRVRKNMSFLVNTGNYQRWEDVKSDMNGTYTHPLRTGTWTIDVSDDMEIKNNRETKDRTENGRPNAFAH